MKSEEFETMHRVAADHWWYGGLRRIVLHHWHIFVHPPRGTTTTVLDAGCGTGNMLKAFPPAAQTVGIDCSPVAIRFCRHKRLHRTAVASLSLLPFPDAVFDVVISCDVLCHEAITDCAAAVGEMARVLKPGGLLMLNLPAYQWLLSSHDTAVSNVRRFTKGEVLQLLQSNSLLPLRATYWNSLLFLPIAAVRLWRKGRPLHHSDLSDMPVWGNAMLSAILAVELALIRFVRSLPWGLSYFAIARK